jgi:hypothetical protein
MWRDWGKPLHQRSTLIFIHMLFLLDGQMDESWNPAKQNVVSKQVRTGCKKKSFTPCFEVKKKTNSRNQLRRCLR